MMNREKNTFLTTLTLANLLSSSCFLVQKPTAFFTQFNVQRATSSTPAVSDAVEKQPPSVSFVTDELRPYAMKLHTRDQAPKEGQQKAQTPFTQWTTTRGDYLQFLADSLEVYQTIEDIVSTTPELAMFKDTGLERSEALRQDIKWITTEYDTSLSAPSSSETGVNYSKFLRDLASESIPRFVCHYYNLYFAHTAGGLRIGQRMADNLLEGRKLEFYQWKTPKALAVGGEYKPLQAEVLGSVDALAQGWTREEREACKEETLPCFKYQGALLGVMKGSAGTPSQ